MITAKRAPIIARIKLKDELNMPESFSDPANQNIIYHILIQLCLTVI